MGRNRAQKVVRGFRSRSENLGSATGCHSLLQKAQFKLSVKDFPYHTPRRHLFTGGIPRRNWQAAPMPDSSSPLWRRFLRTFARRLPSGCRRLICYRALKARQICMQRLTGPLRQASPSVQMVHAGYLYGPQCLASRLRCGTGGLPGMAAKRRATSCGIRVPTCTRPGPRRR